MTRLLALAGMVAGALVALLVWLSARDLRQVIPTPDPEDDMAGVQVDVRPGGVMGPVRPFIVGESGPEYVSQMQLMGPFPWRDPFSTQTGPLGPAA